MRIPSSSHVMRVASSSLSTAIFGMGCFWAPQEAFQATPGVESTRTGYASVEEPLPSTEAPSYFSVCQQSGSVGYTEAVEVTFDPSVVSYDELLQVVWSNHDASQVTPGKEAQCAPLPPRAHPAIPNVCHAVRQTARCYGQRARSSARWQLPTSSAHPKPTSQLASRLSARWSPRAPRRHSRQQRATTNISCQRQGSSSARCSRCCFCVRRARQISRWPPALALSSYSRGGLSSASASSLLRLRLRSCSDSTATDAL